MPGFRASMEGFYDAAMAMSRRILRLLALSLDLPPAWFLDRFKRPLTTLRLLHYSAQPSDPNEVREGPCSMLDLAWLISDLYRSSNGSYEGRREG